MIGGFLFMGLCCLGITVSVLFQVLKKLKNRVLQNFLLIVIQVCKLLWLHMADEPWRISFVNITKKMCFSFMSSFLWLSSHCIFQMICISMTATKEWADEGMH